MEQERVEWALGYTIQPKQFESIRIDVRLGGFKGSNETLKEASHRIYLEAASELLEKLRTVRKDLSDG